MLTRTVCYRAVMQGKKVTQLRRLTHRSWRYIPVRCQSIVRRSNKSNALFQLLAQFAQPQVVEAIFQRVRVRQQLYDQ